jgi:carboxymethylenebutenolidase
MRNACFSDLTPWARVPQRADVCYHQGIFSVRWHVSNVTFESAAGRATGYLELPGPEKPGVVVIQEWWGLVPHIKDVTGRFAAQGYVALAPDLFHGKSTLESAEAQHLMEGLDWGRATVEIAGAVQSLRREQGVTRVGVVGFCMGGALAVLAAAQPGVDVYASFYGFPPAAAGPLDQIQAPGLFFFGEAEDHFSIKAALAFAERQRQRDRQTEVIVYPDAGHAFFNNDRPQVFRHDAANDAWRRTLALFGQTLRGIRP